MTGAADEPGEATADRLVDADGGAAEPEDWTLYLLTSERLTRTYVGIAHDPERRLAQHNGQAPGGARSTRAGRPWRIERTWGPYADRSAAQRAEAELKRERGQARAEWTP